MFHICPSLAQDESEEEYSSEDASDEEYEEELGSDESSGKDWSDLEREAAEDDADLLDEEERGGGRSGRNNKSKEKIRTKHRYLHFLDASNVKLV
jgi:hypothetical protein